VVDKDDFLSPLTIRNADGRVRNTPEDRLHAACLRHLGFREDVIVGGFGYSPEPLDDPESLA
jgi:hypothetical protein